METIMRILGARPTPEPAYVKAFRYAKENLTEKLEMESHDVLGSFVRQVKGRKPSKKRKATAA